MYYSYLESPVGKILLAGDDEGLKFVSFGKGKNTKDPEPEWEQNDSFFQEAKKQLQEYFVGHRKQFQLTLAPSGTPFQHKVLKALQKIPYGTTASYSQIANRIGSPKAMRAVGAANGLNPISVIIPCHRVIGQNGTLTGYAAGLDIKERLLSLEESNMKA